MARNDMRKGENKRRDRRTCEAKNCRNEMERSLPGLQAGCRTRSKVVEAGCILAMSNLRSVGKELPNHLCRKEALITATADVRSKTKKDEVKKMSLDLRPTYTSIYDILVDLMLSETAFSHMRTRRNQAMHHMMELVRPFPSQMPLENFIKHAPPPLSFIREQATRNRYTWISETGDLITHQGGLGTLQVKRTPLNGCQTVLINVLPHLM